MTTIPDILLSHFRTNHAGETGAVYIYKGILKISNDKDIISFSRKHLETEQSHLKTIEDIFPKKEISKFIFLWKILGYLTGFIPAILGNSFIYATIYAVESFVEQHYQAQIKMIVNQKKFYKTQNLIKQLMHDEIEHKKEALTKIKNLSIFHKIWINIVTVGSIVAVRVSKLI